MNTALFDVSHVAPACSTDTSGMRMNMKIEQWWTDTDRG